MVIRVAIVEDDEKIRESLVMLIEDTPGFRCVGAYESAEDALSDFRNKDADVVLMDINLPAMNGVECVRKLKAVKPKLEICMLTVYEDAEKIFSSLEAGATGYLLKRTSPEQLLQGIRDTFEGGSPMSSQIARKVVQRFKEEHQKSEDEVELSEREREILNLLVKGKRYKEIGASLFISPSTVHSHLHNIYEKLHVRSRSEAIVRYMKK